MRPFLSLTGVAPPAAAVASPDPSSPSPSQDDGGFTSSWVNQQEHRLGPLQSTDDTRREIQQMPSARPPVEDEDDEEREWRAERRHESLQHSCLHNA